MENASTGILLDESIPGGREPVEILWGERSLTMRSNRDPMQDRSIDYANARFELGGNRDAFLFVQHPNLGTGRLYLEFTRELRSKLVQIEALRDKLAVPFGAQRKGRTLGLASLAAVIGVILGLVLAREPIARAIVSAIPFATEKRIGDLAFKKTGETGRAEADAKKAFDRMVEPLMAAHPEWRERLTFHIRSEKEMNAFATIGGHMFVNRGLIESLSRAEELLGVLAHEIAHVNERHVARSVFQGAGLFLLVQALLGDVTGIVAVLADQGTPLLMLKHSRELESEADRKAVDALVESKIDPSGLASALRKIKAESEKATAGTPVEDLGKVLSKLDIWSTHPEMDERVRVLEAYAAERRKGAPHVSQMRFDYPAFVKSVQLAH